MVFYQTKTPPQKQIIIEICGKPKLCKKFIAAAVANNLEGEYISLPNFDVTSYTGPALIKAISTPEVLTFPEWWCAISLASLFELNFQSSTNVLVLTNYKTQFKGIFNALKVKGAGKMIEKLPEPNMVFHIQGDPIHYPNHVYNALPDSFWNYVDISLSRSRDSKIKRLGFEDEELKSRYLSVTCNNIVDEICKSVSQKYGLDYIRNDRVSMKWVNKQIIVEQNF